MVLVDAPRRVLHRLRPPRFAVLAPVQATHHVLPASFPRQTVDPRVAEVERVVALPVPTTPEPDGLWVTGPGSRG